MGPGWQGSVPTGPAKGRLVAFGPELQAVVADSARAPRRTTEPGRATPVSVRPMGCDRTIDLAHPEGEGLAHHGVRDSAIPLHSGRVRMGGF